VCTLGQQSTFDSVLYCIRINTVQLYEYVPVLDLFEYCRTYYSWYYCQLSAALCEVQVERGRFWDAPWLRWLLLAAMHACNISYVMAAVALAACVLGARRARVELRSRVARAGPLADATAQGPAPREAHGKHVATSCAGPALLRVGADTLRGSAAVPAPPHHTLLPSAPGSAIKVSFSALAACMIIAWVCQPGHCSLLQQTRTRGRGGRGIRGATSKAEDTNVDIHIRL
jgi:hypothetical protein